VRAFARLSMRVRLRISILILMSTVVLALSGLHVHGIVGGTLEQASTRARVAGDAVQYTLTEVRDNGYLLSEPAVRRILSRSLAQDSILSNIIVRNTHRQIVGSSKPVNSHSVVSWRDWQGRSALRRALDLFGNDVDIAIDVPQTAAMPMGVQVLVSPERVRAAMKPQLLDLALLSLLSLLVSVVIAILVSRVVGDSYDQLGRKIDVIARGDHLHFTGEESNLPEMATLDSKLRWLDRQFSGTRSDMMRMRSNVATMLRQLDEAILVFGPDNRLHMAGEPAERMLAKPREELIGQPASFVFPEWTPAGAVLHRAASSRTSVHEEPVRFDRNNLPPVRLLMTVEPIDYGDGSAFGLLVALRDADTRTRLRTDLDNARRLSAISRITSGVAHEIKNPLNAMMLHLQIAQDKATRNADSQAELRVIGTELVRLDRVVKALLDFHRPLEPKLAQHDLRDLAAEVAALIRPQAEAQNVQVLLESHVDEAMILGDADLLKQGLLNIAFNALEAMSNRRGGILRFTVEHTSGEYSISVRDNGPGIPPENRDRIFNLYFTTKNSTGTGLAMTYRIVLLHSGTLTVDSEVGKGTSFRLGLPTPDPLLLHRQTGASVSAPTAVE